LFLNTLSKWIGSQTGRIRLVTFLSVLVVAAIGVLAWRAHVAPVAVPQHADIAPAQSPPAAAAEVAVHNEPVT